MLSLFILELNFKMPTVDCFQTQSICACAVIVSHILFYLMYIINFSFLFSEPQISPSLLFYFCLIKPGVLKRNDCQLSWWRSSYSSWLFWISRNFKKKEHGVQVNFRTLLQWRLRFSFPALNLILAPNLPYLTRLRLVMKWNSMTRYGIISYLN